MQSAPERRARPPAGTESIHVFNRTSAPVERGHSRSVQDDPEYLAALC
jgi:hypothetical protein